MDRISCVVLQNKATVVAGTRLIWDRFFQNFLFLLIGAVNLLLICRKMKNYQCHICSSHIIPTCLRAPWALAKLVIILPPWEAVLVLDEKLFSLYATKCLWGITDQRTILRHIWHTIA